MMSWPEWAPYEQFDVVDLGDGVSATILDPIDLPGRRGFIVEIYLCHGSMGDGVTDLMISEDGTLSVDAAYLAFLKSQKPNLPVPT